MALNAYDRTVLERNKLEDAVTKAESFLNEVSSERNVELALQSYEIREDDEQVLRTLGLSMGEMHTIFNFIANVKRDIRQTLKYAHSLSEDECDALVDQTAQHILRGDVSKPLLDTVQSHFAPQIAYQVARDEQEVWKGHNFKREDIHLMVKNKLATLRISLIQSDYRRSEKMQARGIVPTISQHRQEMLRRGHPQGNLVTISNGEFTKGPQD